MRIAFACPNFPPEFLGGTERVTLALARALTEGGDEVVVVTGSDLPYEGVDVERESLHGIEVRRLRRHPNEVYGLDLRRPRVQALFDQVLRDERIDVLHVHHWALLTTGLLRGARAQGIAALATLHDVWTACPRFFRRPPAGVTCPLGSERSPCVGCCLLNLPGTQGGIERLIAARDAELRLELAAAQVLTVPSRTCSAKIARHLPWRGELHVVPHGLLEPVGEAVPQPPSPGVLRVGTFGNLVEEKGVALLVQACRDIPGLELHLFGPFLSASFETLVKERAERFGVVLHCHGAYDSRSGAHPARQLDVAVFPSLCEETYGLVVEEALARGVPVVVSDRGALAERIGDGGLAVPVDELGPLANALRGLCERPAELARLRAGIPREFPTIRDAAARYREMYERVADDRP